MKFQDLKKEMPILWKERSCRVEQLDDFTKIAYIQCSGTSYPVPVEAQELELSADKPQEL